MSDETPEPDVPPTSLLDDRTIEALVRGGPVHRRHAGLAGFAREVRAVAEAPAPEAGPALRTLFAGRAANGTALNGFAPDGTALDGTIHAGTALDGTVLDATATDGATADGADGAEDRRVAFDAAVLAAMPRHGGAQDAAAHDTAVDGPAHLRAPRGTAVPRTLGLVARVAGMGVAAKVTLATAMAAAAVGGAGAAGTLPSGADRFVRDAIEAVTPFEFDDPAEMVPPGAGDGSDDRSGQGGPPPTTTADPPAAGTTPGGEGGTAVTDAPGGSGDTPAVTVAPGPDGTPPSTVPATGPPVDPGSPDTLPTPPSTVPDRPGVQGG